MATTYVLAPEPFWTLINLQGTVAGGGKLLTRRSLDIDQDKPVFEDAGGVNALPNPIIFDANGVAHTPFYFQVDSAAPNDAYFLQAQDSEGAILWTIRNFAPGAGGGGGDVTVYQDITNYIANNQFIDHIDDTASPINSTNLVIAPSNHKGFTPAGIPVVGTYGVVGPDIRFVKNNTTATDQITFPLFPLASSPMGPGDVTPVDYIRYVSNSVLGETYKCFQFPITQKVKNLSGQKMTFAIWAAVTSNPVTLSIYTRQYYGSAPTATTESVTTRVLQDTIDLTTTWTLFPVSITIPDVAGNTIGTPGAQTDDDAIYIQLEMPLGIACDVLFIKPALYLGAINPQIDFQDYDQINSINSTPRTGDTRTTLFVNLLPGWVIMNDGSIGNVGSGATTRANKDTFQLYKTIWDGVIDGFAPVSGGRGATAIADFVAGKTLTLTRVLGRVMGAAGGGAGLTFRPLGSWNVTGETHTLTRAELPNPITITAATTNFTPGGATGLTSSATPGGGTIANSGGGNAFSIVQPSTFFNVFIKL